jgi:hypothetical protein
VLLVCLAGCGSSANGNGGGASGASGTGGSGGAAQLSCPGCVSDGVCQPGDTVTACGMDGGTCSVCGGAGIACVKGACGPDPSVVWDVRAVAISVAPTKPDGTDWDVGSPPDPYIACYVNNAGIGETDPAVDSFTATYDTIICPSVPTNQLLGAGLVIDAWDKDTTADDLIGEVPGIGADNLGRISTITLYTPDGVPTGSTVTLSIMLHQ